MRCEERADREAKAAVQGPSAPGSWVAHDCKLPFAQETLMYRHLLLEDTACSTISLLASDMLRDACVVTKRTVQGEMFGRMAIVSWYSVS